MDIYSQTHVGNVRIDNEDTVYISGRKAPLLAMVADGMGGQAGGRTASENAVSYITTELKDKLKKADVEDLKKAAISAGEKIYKIRSILSGQGISDAGGGGAPSISEYYNPRFRHGRSRGRHL